MNTDIEILGILASLIIIRALWYRDIVKLRYWNLVGSILYVVYGMLINSPSVTLLNAVAAVINGYNIIKSHRAVSPEIASCDGPVDDKYGGIITDVNNLPVGTYFYVCNGGWYGTICKDRLGKYIKISGREGHHRLTKYKTYLLSIKILKKEE